MKRLLALCLSALLLVSLLGVTASAAGSLPFADVPEDFPFREEIQYVYDAGLMNGTSGDTFSPEQFFTRAMFVTMLGRMEGIDPNQYPGSRFKDVPIGNWAAPYINWAAQNNIVNGVGNGMFSPGDIINEEQYCTIVCRYMDAKGYDFPGSPVWTPEIADASEISTWAKASVINLCYYNLAELDENFCFIPRMQMSRLNVACYFADLHRMLKQHVCPTDVHDPATSLVLDDGDIIAITRAAASYLGNWFYFNSYCDIGDTVTAPNPYSHDASGNGVFERVTNPYVSSVKALTDLGYKFYVSDIVQAMKESKQTLERNNSLYLSKPDGLGGFMIDRAHIDADIVDTGYVLTFSYYAGNELMYSQETRLIYDGSRWVFGDRIDVCLMDAYIDIAWG